MMAEISSGPKAASQTQMPKGPSRFPMGAGQTPGSDVTKQSWDRIHVKGQLVQHVGTWA